MFFPFFSLCSMPCAGIGRSSGAGTGIAVGGRGHYDLGILARIEESIEVGEKHRISYCAYAGINDIVSIVKYAATMLPRSPRYVEFGTYK